MASQKHWDCTVDDQRTVPLRKTPYKVRLSYRKAEKKARKIKGSAVGEKGIFPFLVFLFFFHKSIGAVIMNTLHILHLYTVPGKIIIPIQAFGDITYHIFHK